MTFTAACLPYWRSNDIEGEVIETIRRSSGLWTKCTYISTGNWNCDAFDRFFIGLPPALQAARALTIISLLFQFFAVCVAIVGLDCTTVAMDQPRTKARAILISGVCNVVGALCIGVAVSWFAANVLYDYHNPLSASSYTGNFAATYNTGERYIYGACLFLGWGAMCLGIMTGALFCCNSMSTMRDENDQDPYTQGFDARQNLQYSAPKSMGHEYI